MRYVECLKCEKEYLRNPHDVWNICDPCFDEIQKKRKIKDMVNKYNICNPQFMASREEENPWEKKICDEKLNNNKIFVSGTRFKRGDWFDQMIERATKAQHAKEKAIDHFTMVFQGWKEEKLEDE